MRRIFHMAALLRSALRTLRPGNAEGSARGAVGASPRTAADAKQVDASIAKSVDALVKQLTEHPAEPSTAAGRVGLLLIDANGGEASLIAEEPDPWLCRCGSPAWSSDGKRILFDVTPGNKDYSYSRIKGLELADGHLAVTDLGPGNCPQFSPSDDRVVFVLNNGAIPGAEAGVWLMNASGSDRRKLGGYGRPRWSPDGHQFMILSFSDPCEVMLVDDRPGLKSGPLQIADFKFFGVPGWAGPGRLSRSLVKTRQTRSHSSTSTTRNRRR